MSNSLAHRSRSRRSGPACVRMPRTLLVIGILVLSTLGLAAPASATGAAAPDAPGDFLNESFTGTSVSSGWVLGGSAAACLTAKPSCGNEGAGNGWLRLTNANTYQAGYAYYDTPIPTGRGLVITFDYGAWGGTGADGTTFFLFDGATTTFRVGASGGSLGYAQKTGVLGLSNGYLGLGLDEFGNYSNGNEGRSGGIGATPEAVAIRGPGNGYALTDYPYLAGTLNLTKPPSNLPRIDCPKNNTLSDGTKCGTGTSRPSTSPLYYRQVRITVTPVGSAYRVTAEMKFNSGTFQTLFGPYTMPTAAPGTLKMGFAASTGGATNYHEIRNLTVAPQVPDLTATKSVQNATTGGGSVAPGEQLLYTVVLKNNTSSAISSVSFTDLIPTNTTYVANSASASSGTVAYTASPATLSVSGITVPANGQATITFKVQVNSPLDGGVTQISNQGSFTYNSTPSQTDGDAVTDGNQATVIGVTAGPNFDTSTKTVSLFTDTSPTGAVSPGDTLLYHVVLPNTGNQNASAVTFSDVMPGNTTYVGNSALPSSGSASYNSSNKTLTWTGSINAGSQVTLDFRVTVNSSVQIRDVISNQGAVTSGSASVLTDADLTTPGKQPTQLLAGGVAYLTATKTASVVGSSLQPGGYVDYTIVLTNPSSYAISNATFTDNIPANTTYVIGQTPTIPTGSTLSTTSPAFSVTGINLAAGSGYAEIKFRVQLDSSLPTGTTQISNQGSVSYDATNSGSNNTTLQTDGDSNTSGQQATVTAIPYADLAVTKTVDKGTPAEGDTIIYTVRVTNNGTNQATGVQVTDALPAGLTYVSSSPEGSYIGSTWTIGTLNSGASATLTLNATVNLGTGGSDSTKNVSNSASASSAIYDPYSSNNSASAGLTVETTTLTGVITDKTTGAKLANVTVTVTDSSSPTANVCTATTDSNGVYAVISGVGDCLMKPGTATIQVVTAPDGYIKTTTSTTITAGTANTENLPLVQPSLNGTVTTLGSGVPIVGATVTLKQGETTICSTTTGSGGAFSFVAGSTSPSCSFTDGSYTVTASLTRYQDASASPSILSTGPTTQDLQMGTVDLLITKSDSVTAVQPGETLDYVLTVVNNGSIAATSVTMDDRIPAYLTLVSDTSGLTRTESPTGTYHWTLGSSLATSASWSFTVRATVATSLPDGATSLSNYAHVSTASPEKDTTNNEVTDVDTVTTHPDLSIAKTFTSASPAGTGSTVSYKLTGGNSGHAIAHSVTIVDTQDALNTYAAGSTSLKINGNAVTPYTGASWNNDTKKLTMTLPDLAPTDTYEMTYNVTVGTVGIPPQPLINSATIDATEADLNTGNDTASVSVPTAQNVDVYVVKTAVASTDPAVPGGQIVYTLSYGNNGQDGATNVTISDVVPDNTTYSSSSCSVSGGTVNTCSLVGSTVTFNVGSLASRATGTASFTVQIASTLPAAVTAIANTATIASSPADSAAGNNTSTTSTPVTAQPDLRVSKTDGTSKTTVLAGETVAYTIKYQNVGNQAASGVTIVDTLLNGVTIDPDQLSGITYNGSSPSSTYTAPTSTAPGYLTWSIGPLTDFTEHTINLSLKVDSSAIPSSVAADRVTIDDDHNNGTDPNLGDNTATDSDLVIAPYVVLEKSASVTNGNPAGVTYTGQNVTYTIAWHNTGATTAKDVTISDVIPAGSSFVAGSIKIDNVTRSDSLYSSGTITWPLGDQAADASGTVSFVATVNPGAGGATQTAATLSTETGSGSVTVTSKASAYTSLPWCDTSVTGTAGVTQGSTTVTGAGTKFATELSAGKRIEIAGVVYIIASVTDDTTLVLTANYTGSTALGLTIKLVSCLAFVNVYQGTNGTPPAGYNDNPRMTAFNDASWTQPAASSTDEFSYWTSSATLSAEWVAPNTAGHLDGNYSFFRQAFCLPLNATGLSATLDLAGDDASDIYLNGVYLGQEYGAGGASAFDGVSGIQSGINMLAVQLLNNRHGGHEALNWQDHIGLLFNLQAGYTGLRPFAYGPSAARTGIEVTFTIDPLALGGRQPYVYKIDYGDGNSDPYQTGTSFKHTYTNATNAPVVRTATITARAQYGCTGTDQVAITVLPSGSNLLANPATVTYTDSKSTPTSYSGASGAGLELDKAANLAIAKTVIAGGTVPGQGVTYQLVVTNSGPDAVTGATVADTLPAAITSATWSCSASSGSSCAASGTGNINDSVSLLANSTATYTVLGAISPAATGSLANTATVTAPSDVTDLATSNNTSTATSTLTPSVVLAITNVSSPNPGLAPGRIVTYIIEVSNSGPSDATGVSVADTFPAALTNVTWTCSATSGSSCASSGSGNISDTAVIVVGGKVTYTVTATVDPGTAADTLIANTATATPASGTGDAKTATDNNTVKAMTTLSATKDALNGSGGSSRSVSFVDTDSNGGISPGDTLKYRVTITAGGSTAFNVIYTDTPDANTTLKTPLLVTCVPGCTVTQGNTEGDTTVSASIASIAAGNSVTIDYQVTVNATLPFQLVTLTNQGSVASSNADSLLTADSQSSGATILTLKRGSIGGLAWKDTNGDGKIDVGETNMNHVPMTLYFAGVDNVWNTDDDQAVYSESDASGAFKFEYLATGTYRVVFYSLEGYKFGPVGTGLDNMANPDTGMTSDLSLGINAQMESINAGESSNPLAVELSAFTATRTPGGVTLAWETVSEQDNAGFNLYRSASAAGPWAPLNTALIPSAAPGSGEGHSYTWLDATGGPGSPCFYRLDALDRFGVTTELGAATACIPPSHTWLPLIVR